MNLNSSWTSQMLSMKTEALPLTTPVNLQSTKKQTKFLINVSQKYEHMNHIFLPENHN